jgi:hypothetical protein
MKISAFRFYTVSLTNIMYASLGLLLIPCEMVNAADYELKPRIAVSEEFTDNVDTSGSASREEYITRAQPGFSFIYKAPVLDLNASYNFDYRHYAKGAKGDEYTHNLSSAGAATVIDNFFFIQASDTYKRVTLDVARDNTSESLYLNQSDQNTGTVSPYFVWRLGNNSSLKTGYRYTNIWYKEPSGIDKREHAAFADATHELLPKFSLTWGYLFSDSDSSRQQFKRHNAYGGFRYEYSEKSFIFGQAGNTWQSYDNGVKVSNIYWNAGLTHEFSFATATVETRTQYTEDPLRSSIQENLYSGRLTRSFTRGNLDLYGSYSEFVITETGQIDRKKLSLGTLGKYEIIDRLNLSLSTLGERYSQTTTSDFPYKFTGKAGLAYSFNNDLGLSLNYYHITYRHEIARTLDSKDINRVVLELSKTF